MAITERLQIISTHNEPLNKYVVWLHGNVFKKWNGDGWEIIGGGGSGTTDYNELKNKPSINGKPLVGNVELELGESQVDLSNYYTKQDIDNKNFLTEHQSLEGYATKEWVENQGFIVEIPNIDLTDYATRQFVLDEITKAQLNGGEVDLTDYATKSELQEVANLIPSIEDYATKIWVNEQGFIQDIPEEYAKKTDIPSLSGYATETFVQEKINEAQLGGGENGEGIDLSIYATKEWVSDNYLSDIPTDYITEEELNDKGFALEADLSRYQESIFDLEDIRQGASKGATALQSIPSEIEQQIADKVDKSTLAPVATSGSYNDLSDKPTIHDTITESTVSEWGFTKNTGNYSKPSDGIPKNDLDNDVQLSLGKADTALQSYTEQYRGTVTGVRVNNSTKNSVSGIVDIGNVVTGVKINNSTKNPSNGIVDLGTVITSHQDISGKQDTLIAGTNIKTINGNSILGEGNIEIETTIDENFATIEDYNSEVLMPLSSIVSITQEEYDSLASKNPNTIYLIVS